MTKEEMQHVIDYEIIVDCYGDEEVAIGWQTYLGDTISYPFEAKVKLKNRNGRTSLEKVEVLGEANVKSSRYFVDPEITLEVSQIGSEFVFKAKVGELRDVVADESTTNAIKIWNYWNKS